MHSKSRRSKRNTNSAKSCGLAALLLCLLLFRPHFCKAADQPTATPIPFRNAVELALEHSGVMGIAAMNQWRAHQAYLEVRANWIPQLTVGSGLGYSYGFPLTLEGSAPSLVNFNSSQAFFNLPLKQYLKAAKIQWQATSLDVQDKRDAVILDVALTYAQLDQLAAKIAALTAAQTAAEKGEFISRQRLQEGIDSKLDVTRSQLLTARIRLRIAEAQGQSEVLRQHLASLLGVQPDTIVTDPESVPAIPETPQDEDVPAIAVSNSLAVKQAHEATAAAQARAKAERDATKYPTIDLASQYAYLAKFNNYDQYFRNYTSNNLAAGLNIKFPFFNAVQKAKAEQAKADAIIGSKQEELTKEKVREDALQLQRSLRQLAAARDVAKLEWEVSQGDLEGVKGRMQTGEANVRDQQNAELDTNDKRAAYLDAEFELSRAELQLLRLTGGLESWAIPGP